MMLTATIIALTALQCTESYMPQSNKMTHRRSVTQNMRQPQRITRQSRLHLSEENDQQLKGQSQKLARLNAMAAKLRAEASAMEVAPDPFPLPTFNKPTLYSTSWANILHFPMFTFPNQALYSIFKHVGRATDCCKLKTSANLRHTWHQPRWIDQFARIKGRARHTVRISRQWRHSIKDNEEIWHKWRRLHSTWRIQR